MLWGKIFLGDDNAAASSQGNPSVPESLLSKHLAQTGEKEDGGNWFPKSSQLLLLGGEWETPAKNQKNQKNQKPKPKGLGPFHWV